MPVLTILSSESMIHDRSINSINEGLIEWQRDENDRIKSIVSVAN